MGTRNLQVRRNGIAHERPAKWGRIPIEVCQTGGLDINLANNQSALTLRKSEGWSSETRPASVSGYWGKAKIYVSLHSAMLGNMTKTQRELEFDIAAML